MPLFPFEDTSTDGGSEHSSQPSSVHEHKHPDGLLVHQHVYKGDKYSHTIVHDHRTSNSAPHPDGEANSDGC